MSREIARVASRLFATRGYDATSVREIVEAAGVTKPTLYYHFGSKEGLAQAVLTRPMTEFVARLREHLAIDDPVKCLVRQVATHFDFMRDDPDRGRFVYALFFGPLGSSLATELAGFAGQLYELFGLAVGRLAQANLIDPARADRFTTACRGAITVLTMDFLYKPCLAATAGGTDVGAAGFDTAGAAGTLVADLIAGFGPRTSIEGLHA